MQDKLVICCCQIMCCRIFWPNSGSVFLCSYHQNT
uniref:Uncharacterized protein n=1 Tax=Arundo donax TaxID=35708 RepID=A0A0A9GXQ5_ARUDO